MRDILTNAQTKVKLGLSRRAATGGGSASAAHYALAALELLRTDGHAVQSERMYDIIGAAAADELVQDNLLAFQDAAPLGSPVEGRLLSSVAMSKCFRPVSAGEVVMWREYEARLCAAAERLSPRPREAGSNEVNALPAAEPSAGGGGGGGG